MTDLLVKYQQLNHSHRQQLKDFLDFLLSKQKKQKGFDMEAYRKRILGVSVWSEEDIQELIQNSSCMNNWKVEEW